MIMFPDLEEELGMENQDQFMGEEVSGNPISSEDDIIPMYTDAMQRARSVSHESEHDFGENFGEEELHIRNVRNARNRSGNVMTIRNLREMEDTNIGIGISNLLRNENSERLEVNPNVDKRSRE